jgi:serine/threonine protein kinase
VYGDGVNTAARVQSSAEPGQIVATDAVERQVRNRPDYRLFPLGTRALKGLDEPLRLFLVSNPSQSIGPDLGQDYRILHEIGRGGMATVYLADDLKHDRQVAVKVLQPKVANAVEAERFLREIKVVARLTHPQILPLHDSGKVDSHVYYVMPFVDGGSLGARLEASGRMSVDEALQITLEIVDALRTAHAQGIIHRDIKPENVLMLKGHALLADFGIAAVQEAEGATDLTGTGVVLGSPAYMSPEQVSGDPVGTGSDLYSLGCVLFQMLSGEKPFEAPTRQAMAFSHMSRQAPTLASRGIDVPPGVEALVACCLEKTPENRFEFADGTPRVRATERESEQHAPHLGALVSRMCDRWRQVNAFEAAMREGWKSFPGQPQIFVIPGDEGSGHSSLIERLVHTRIGQFAGAVVSPREAGRVVRADVPWPSGGDLQVSSRDLALSLFRELSPSYMGDELSAKCLTELPNLRLAPVVVVEHDLWSRHWNPATLDVLSWYLREFWGKLPRREDQLWLVFVKIIQEPSAKGFLGRILGPRRRHGIEQALAAGMPALKSAGCVTRLDKLGPVTVEDVKDWFAKNHIYDSDVKRARLAESIFGGLPQKSLAVVEAALAEIHQNFLAEQAI